MNHKICSLALMLATISSSPTVQAADEPAATLPPVPKFEAQTIDAKISIGYGLAIGDVDGDGKPDILLADKKQIVWYRNGDWKKFVMAEDLTPQDNVCIAARDIDGSGKVSVAVGAGWNPSETTDPSKSGGVFYLIRPADPTQRWEPVRMHHEVTTHRMHWVETEKGVFKLVVLPLHGLANKDGKGAGVRILAYDVPKDPKGEWKANLVNDTMHMTHNFDVSRSKRDDTDILWVAGSEGIGMFWFDSEKDGIPWWSSKVCTHPEMKMGAGEVRGGKKTIDAANTTIEPMHGNRVVFYSMPKGIATDPSRLVLDDTLAEGHALGCADFLGMKQDQIVAGWRALNKDKKVGIKMYVPLDDKGEKWATHLIDDNQMACEDLKIADLDGDGQPDIIAAGRASHNVVIYWNRSKAK